MKSPILIKGLTLLSFLILIILFLLYRTGNLNIDPKKEQSTLQSFSDKIGDQGVVDTLIPKKDSSQKLTLPSSKSIIVSKDNTIFFDSSQKRKSKFDSPKSKKRKIMFSGSKSGAIINPTFKPTLDSILLDSIKNKRIQ
jgi:hypothetical protein